ncbi:MAG: hypothetical protein ACI379_10135 [Nocardioides sp.]|uniref:hypothetical protein n=1 Tax=Nocardioides sp. TaxID=35761 RepID=UPI003F0B4FE7
MTELHPTRRTVVRTAAWAVPAVSLVSAAPAFAATPTMCLTSANPVIWQDITLTRYTRVRTLVTSPITNRTDGITKVDFTFRLPQYVLAGATVPAQPISYVSTLGLAATNAAYDGQFGIGGRTVVSGTMNTTYDFGGGLTPASTPIPMTLNPGNVAIVRGTRIATTFTGTMPALTASTSLGVRTINFAIPPEPVESDASTWPGTQVVRLSVGSNTNARVHSTTPTTVTANDWVPTGTVQSLNIATYEVVPAC